MPFFANIDAQSLATLTLGRAIAEDRLSQSYLFEGPSGVGKTLTALALARAVVCGVKHAPNAECAVCARIDAGQHPDVRVFRPRDEGAGNIPVEFLRETILPFTRYAPFEAPKAVAIFPSADVSFPSAHPEAANAMLKTLEEPRANLVFILTSERPERLLPTIRSRTQRIAFRALPDETMRAILTSRGITSEVADAVLPLAGGSADVAIALAEGETARDLVALAIRVDRALSAGGPGELTELAEKIAKHDQLPLMLTTLSSFYRDVASRALLGGSAPLRFAAYGTDIATAAARTDAGVAAERSHAFGTLTELLDRNANAELTLGALFFRLRGDVARAAR